MTAGRSLELVITPRTERFDPDDDRWREQVGEFTAALQREIGEVRRERIPVAGTKGGIELIIMALGSAGVLTAAVEFFKAWLQRDRTRSLEITHTIDGHEETIQIRGAAISDDVLGKLADALVRRLDRPDGGDDAPI